MQEEKKDGNEAKALPSSKLADFSARLQAARDVVQDTERTRGEGASRLGLAWRVSLDLVTVVAVGSGLGWFLDNELGTRPWFMCLLLLLGGAAGMMNAYRVVRGLDESVSLGQASRQGGKQQYEEKPGPDGKRVNLQR